jgi:hypothetical protein
VPARVVTVVLALAVALLMGRLAERAFTFVRSGAQMDLAAYWAAARATSAGLSPYVNHVERDPALWDGIAIHRHSRFIYPPLAARLLTPLGHSSYAQLKAVWTVSALLALGLAIALAVRLAGLTMTLPCGLALAGLTAAYYPALALLERGQSDAHLLLLLLGAIALLRRPGWILLGGALLAAAALFKLYLILVVPFLIARRQWRAVAGWALGALCLAALSLAISGPALLESYVHEQLPRIARHGDGGSPSTRLSAGVLARLAAGLPAGTTAIDGEAYTIESLRFSPNATLVRTPLGRATWNAMKRLGLDVAPAHVSGVFFAIAFASILALTWRTQLFTGAEVEPWIDLAWWQVVLTSMLLFAPLTWAMGTVWLLPAAPIAWRAWRAWQGSRGGEAGRSKTRLSAGLAVAGVLVAALPDPWVGMLALKYPLAEGLVLLGMLGLLIRQTLRRPYLRGQAGIGQRQARVAVVAGGKDPAYCVA